MGIAFLAFVVVSEYSYVPVNDNRSAMAAVALSQNYSIKDAQQANDLLVQTLSNGSNLQEESILAAKNSPYITAILPSSIVQSDQVMTLVGTRFATSSKMNDVYIKDAFGVVIKKFSLKSVGGESIKFTPKIPAGEYLLQVVHPITGQSNVVPFVVLSTSTPVSGE